MTKPEQTRLTVLFVLLAGAGALAYFSSHHGSSTLPVISIEGSYEPIAVENPSLRMDLLEGLRHVEYTGSHRNIFSETPPPRVPTPEELKKIAQQQRDIAPPTNVPPPPPPVAVDLKFYGYVDDPRTGARRAFFTNGEDIFIAGVGDMLENRLRVTRIGNDTVELMEVSSSRRTTVAIEQDAHP